MRRVLWLVLLLITVPMTAAAQETRGNISGTVRDSGGVVPGASVQVKNLETNITQNLVTNGSGYFEAPPQFGQVTTVALNQMRFFTFGIRTTF